MRQSTRLILNTGATYVRMGATMGMGLFATRLAIQELGLPSYNLWCLLNMAVTGLLFLAEACYGSAERSMALAIGTADPGRLRRVFTNGTAMQLAVTVAFVVIGVALTLFAGPWLLSHIGVAPADSSRAITAFNLMVGAMGFWIASQTFRSMFVAHQELVWLTLSDLVEATLRLGAIIATLYMPGERLVSYCLMLMVAQAGVMVMLVGLCRRSYRSAWPRLADLDLKTARGLFNFGAWAVLGNFSYRVRTSGPPLVLGSAFSAAYNGAFGVAQQLAGYQVSLASAIMRAAQPAINAAHGRGDRTTVEHLAHLVNKYSVLLALFYIVPIEIEAPHLLLLWLKTPPPMSDTFVRLALIALCIPWITMGHHLAIFGHGGIRRYMTLSLVLELTALGMGAGSVLWRGLPAWTVLAYTVVGQCWIGCLVLHAAWRSQGIRLRSWVTHSIGPVLLVLIPAGGAALAVNQFMGPGAARIITVGAVYAMVAAPLIWGVGMGRGEREHFLRLGRAVGGKITSVLRRGPGRSDVPPSGGAGPEEGTVGKPADGAPLAAGAGPDVR
jgi:O-antigen/teichoic acid export membrane protein